MICIQYDGKIEIGRLTGKKVQILTRPGQIVAGGCGDGAIAYEYPSDGCRNGLNAGGFIRSDSSGNGGANSSGLTGNANSDRSICQPTVDSTL